MGREEKGAAVSFQEWRQEQGSVASRIQDVAVREREREREREKVLASKRNSKAILWGSGGNALPSKRLIIFWIFSSLFFWNSRFPVVCVCVCVCVRVCVRAYV